MHLHGHTFWVVRSAGNSSYNFVDPIVRDVVSIGNTGDNVTIRFFTDNPGAWFLHCHIDWHLEKFVIPPPSPTISRTDKAFCLVALRLSLPRMFPTYRQRSMSLVSCSPACGSANSRKLVFSSCLGKPLSRLRHVGQQDTNRLILPPVS